MRRCVQLWEMNALNIHYSVGRVFDDEDLYELLNHFTECKGCRERWVFDKKNKCYRDRVEMEVEMIGTLSKIMFLSQQGDKIRNKLMEWIADESNNYSVKELIENSGFSEEVKHDLLVLDEKIQFIFRYPDHVHVMKKVLNIKNEKNLVEKLENY